MKHFCKEESCQVNKVLMIVGINSIPLCRTQVHVGTKIDVLLAYSIESKQQSVSFPLVTSIKETN